MWWRRFVNRLDAYAKQEITNGTCQYFSKYKEVGPDLFAWHLDGLVTVGLPAIDQDGLSRWGCFDSDLEDGSLDRIAETLTKHNWYHVREGRRPGRAGHLWIFFDLPVPASDLRLFARRIIEAASVSPSSIELFPKQDKATWDEEKQRFKCSSIVRLPLGVNRKPDANGGRGWFDGVEQDLATQAAWIEAQPLNSSGALMKHAPELRRLALAKAPKPSKFENAGPVDLARLQRALSFIRPGATRGEDYELWVKIGGALKYGGVDLAVWEEWSKRSPYYEPDICQKKWPTFTREGAGAAGLGTIFHLAQGNGFEGPLERFGSVAGTALPSPYNAL